MDAGRLLAYSGIAASVVIGSSTIINTHISLGHRLTHPAALFQFALLAAFSWAFWHVTHPRDGGRRIGPVVLLGFQIVAAASVAAELFVVLAMEIPFVVRSRAAFRWLAGMAVMELALCVAAAWYGDFTVSEIVANTPRPLAMALTSAMMLVWTLFAFSAGYLILQLEESRRAMQWARAQLEGSQHLLAETARIGERLRISRELHDTIGHHLTGLSLNLEVASQTTSEAALKPIQRAQLIARMLLAETREVLASIRGDQSLDLRPALQQLGEGMRRPVCHLEVGEDISVGPAAARALFRCAQEAMTNAARHSEAAGLWLSIRRSPGRVLFECRDDGAGVAAIAEGNGLRGMRERFAELGGELEIESVRGLGFLLRGWIPDAESAA
jgi:signal transduction histidine kinase